MSASCCVVRPVAAVRVLRQVRQRHVPLNGNPSSRRCSSCFRSSVVSSDDKFVVDLFASCANRLARALVPASDECVDVTLRDADLLCPTKVVLKHGDHQSLQPNFKRSKTDGLALAISPVDRFSQQLRDRSRGLIVLRRVRAGR